MEKFMLLVALGMLLSGSMNTLLTKFQDNIVVGETPDGSDVYFLHPVFQTGLMFGGEFLCLVGYLIFYNTKKRLGWGTQAGPLEGGEAPLLAAPRVVRPGRWKRRLRRYLAFSLPMLCDVTATTTLNVGLYLTYASTFQMLRGTLVLFTGLMTILILRRPLRNFQWTGLALIVSGAFVVGAASVLGMKAPASSDGDASPGEHAPRAAPDPLMGNLLCIVAQIGTATQIVIEEKFMTRYKCHPVLAVGLEGFWGLVLTALLVPWLGKVRLGPGAQPIDDLTAAFSQVFSHRALWLSSVIAIFGVSLFNACGMTITRHLSGASRSTIDATRTLIVWGMSLALGWEAFHILQMPGFLLLLSGAMLYNKVVRLDGVFDYGEPAEGEPAYKPESAVGAGESRPRGGLGSALAEAAAGPGPAREEDAEAAATAEEEDDLAQPLLPAARGRRGAVAVEDDDDGGDLGLPSVEGGFLARSLRVTGISGFFGPRRRAEEAQGTQQSAAAGSRPASNQPARRTEGFSA
jgi:drug/metabolite transporter (DMT)-like permease